VTPEAAALPQTEEARACGRWFAALVGVEVLLMWIIPVLPGQDLPSTSPTSAS
jgi:hypothetical protein